VNASLVLRPEVKIMSRPLSWSWSWEQGQSVAGLCLCVGVGYRIQTLSFSHVIQSLLGTRRFRGFLFLWR